MQEREVTVGQKTYSLPEPFFTIATQNPIEQEGTYPLPEAQFDRFMFNIKVDYPTAEEEERILAQTTRGTKVEVRKILSGRAIVNLQGLVDKVAVSEYILQYVRQLVRSTRPKSEEAPKYVQDLVDWGAGPRAGIFLIQGGKALAAMDGRFSVAIEDVQKVAVPVLRHRISTNFQAQAEGMSTEDVIERLVRETPPPVIPKYREIMPSAEQYLKPKVIRQIKRLDLPRAVYRQGLSARSARQPLPRLFRRVQRTSQVHARRRPQGHRLADLRQDRQILREEVRGRDEHHGLHDDGP